jgi:replicative DNA helicase
MDKLPPHSVESEEAVIGSCLVDPDQISNVSGIIKPEDFYREKNAWIFDALLKLGDEANQITVSDQLSAMGKLEGCSLSLSCD